HALTIPAPQARRTVEVDVPGDLSTRSTRDLVELVLHLQQAHDQNSRAQHEQTQALIAAAHRAAARRADDIASIAQQIDTERDRRLDGLRHSDRADLELQILCLEGRTRAIDDFEPTAEELRAAGDLTTEPAERE